MESLDRMGLKPQFVGWALIAYLGEFLDAYAIVAYSVALLYINPYYRIPTALIGLVPAIFGYTWATTGVGGSHISDLIGRKRLYLWDQVLMIVGFVTMLGSSFVGYNLYMLIAGYAIVGVGVALDLSSSEALVAEITPKGHRGKLMTFANILWYCGPITALLLSLAFPPNITGFRALFGFGAGFSILIIILRMFLIESPRFFAIKGEIEKMNRELAKAIGEKQQMDSAQREVALRSYRWKDLFMPGLIGFTIFITWMDILWEIPASTFGVYLPYISKAIGQKGFVGAIITDLIWFLTSIVGLFACWIYVDKPAKSFNRKTWFIISSLMVGIGFIMFGIIPLSSGVLGVLSIAIIGFFQGFGVWPIIWIWASEGFPTAIRSAGWGFMEGTSRYFNYTWTLLLPTILIVLGLKFTAFILASMEIISAIAAVFFAPKGFEAQSLEELEKRLEEKLKR